MRAKNQGEREGERKIQVLNTMVLVGYFQTFKIEFYSFTVIEYLLLRCYANCYTHYLMR